MRITKKEYKIADLNSKIVHISDIHYSSKKDLFILNRILEDIKSIKPNFICITGDLTDKSMICDEDNLIEWIKELSKIGTTIISIGNHEFYIKKSHKQFGLNQNLLGKIIELDNVYLLDNKNVKISNINFIGFTQPLETYNKRNIDKYLSNLNILDGTYNILLVHSPIDICRSNFIKNSKIKLVLCGHMHGGIVPKVIRPIFKTNGIISPYKGMFPKYAYGKIKINNTTVIITSGIKVIKLLKKFFSSEIVIINNNCKVLEKH